MWAAATYEYYADISMSNSYHRVTRREKREVDGGIENGIVRAASQRSTTEHNVDEIENRDSKVKHQ